MGLLRSLSGLSVFEVAVAFFLLADTVGDRLGYGL